MPQYLITYDIKENKPDPHPAVLVHAEKKGLIYLRLAEGKIVFKLPDTTLWGVFENVTAARKAFDDAVAAAGQQLNIKVVVEKLYMTKIEETNWESDKNKKAEVKWTSKTMFETCRLHQLNDPFF